MLIILLCLMLVIGCSETTEPDITYEITYWVHLFEGYLEIEYKTQYGGIVNTGTNIVGWWKHTFIAESGTELYLSARNTIVDIGTEVIIYVDGELAASDHTYAMYYFGTTIPWWATVTFVLQ